MSGRSPWCRAGGPGGGGKRPGEGRSVGWDALQSFLIKLIKFFLRAQRPTTACAPLTGPTGPPTDPVGRVGAGGGGWGRLPIRITTPETDISGRARSGCAGANPRPNRIRRADLAPLGCLTPLLGHAFLKLR